MRRVLALWFARPILDLVPAAILVVVILRWVHTDLFFARLDPPGRRASYQTLASLAGTLLGFTVTSVSVLLTNQQQRMGGFAEGLPVGTVRSLVRVLFGFAYSLAAGCVAGLVLLAYDTTHQHGQPVAQALLLAGLLIVVARFARVLMFLRRLVVARAARPPAGNVTEEELA